MHIHKWIDIDIIENHQSHIYIYIYMFTKVFSTSHDTPETQQCVWTRIQLNDDKHDVVSPANSTMALNHVISCYNPIFP